VPALQHTPVNSHGAFEPGDTGLDPGPESSKTMVNLFTAAHIGLFKTVLFGKIGIFDISV
jgi:hypothetical protein